MTTFTTEDRTAAGAVPEGFAPMAGKVLRPMSFAQIQDMFGMTLGDEGMHAAIADMIELVRKIEKFHGIG